VLRLVLDPARGREMLRKLLLRGSGDRNVAAEDNGARGGGALIDGKDERHGSGPWGFPCAGRFLCRRQRNGIAGGRSRRVCLTLPWRGRVASHGAKRNAERGGVTVSPRKHCPRGEITPPRSRFARSTLPLQGRVKISARLSATVLQFDR